MHPPNPYPPTPYQSYTPGESRSKQKEMSGKIKKHSMANGGDGVKLPPHKNPTTE